MELKTFSQRVEEELQPMNREQIVFFAWLCAVRALPLTGNAGNFNYWGKKDRKKRLYFLFGALDTNIYCINGERRRFYSSWYSFRRSIEVGFDNIKIVASSSGTAIASAAIASAAFASKTSEASASTPPLISSAISSAISSSVSIANFDIKFQIQEIILEDLKKIKEGEKAFNHDLSIYGAVWDNFQKALANEGCSYWGRLYQAIFENSFQLDYEALERRMNVPVAIQEQGAEEVARYLEAFEAGAKHLNEARIIILGEKGAGKTCLARRLIDSDAPMTKDNESTAGVVTTPWEPKKEEVKIHIWDFAGHVVTHAVHQFFLSERCLYILVYDGRAETRNRLEYWLNNVKNYGADSKVFILVNKRDDHVPAIPIHSLKDKYPIEGLYFFDINKDKDALEEFRKRVVEYIKTNPSWSNREIPANYFNVKKALEQRFSDDKKKECIEIEEFKQIALENGIKDVEKLLTHLHLLGICLHYNDMGEFDTLVLNPEWISQGIYRIINWVHDHNEHSIKLNEFSTVFSDEMSRYPKDKHPFLFELMKRYELAYETEKKCNLIIPHLLHVDRPKTLPDFPVGDSLMLRYKAEQPLLTDTISRFIVRHNEEIKREGRAYLVWRYGVVLEEENGTIALVREWQEERMITVEVKGNDKTAYLDKLRETLNDIFSKYKSKKPELQYRIERFGQIPEERENNTSFIEPIVLISNEKEYWKSEETILFHYLHDYPLRNEQTNIELSTKNIIDAFRILGEKMFEVTNRMMDVAEKAVDKTHGNTYIDSFNHSNIGEGNSIKIEVLSEDLRREIENIIPDIRAIANGLSDEQEEILAELQRINVQLDKKQPKLAVVGAAFQAIYSILGGVVSGVAANLVTPFVKSSIQEIMSKLGGLLKILPL